jgi:hypothetical protein
MWQISGFATLCAKNDAIQLSAEGLSFRILFSGYERRFAVQLTASSIVALEDDLLAVPAELVFE